jgi:hypothetical protein
VRALARSKVCALLTTPLSLVAQLACAMTFESDGDLELNPHVELGLRTQSRGALREAVAERSTIARRVLADVCRRPPPGRRAAV